jgi:hypothetical protein
MTYPLIAEDPLSMAHETSVGSQVGSAACGNEGKGTNGFDLCYSIDQST